MSIRLMTAIWDVVFPTQSQKLIALKLADYANDDGTSVYPAADTLAEKIGCSRATVFAILRAFRGCGLLSVVKQGGNGPKDTTEYRINVEMVRQLAHGTLTLEGCSTDLEVCGEPVDNKGPISGLDANVRVQSDENKGPVSGQKGSNRWTQPVIEPSLLESSARERAKDSNLDLKKIAAQRRAFTLTASDSQFASWLDWLRQHDRCDLSEAAEAAGSLVVFDSKWPSESSPTPKVPDSGTASVRAGQMVGGAA